MNDLPIKLQVFENALWKSYKMVRSDEGFDWCSLHKVMEKVGMSLPLFTERLNQLWDCQFSVKPIYANKYDFGLEVDFPLKKWYYLRKKLIIVNRHPAFIINMAVNKH